MKTKEFLYYYLSELDTNIVSKIDDNLKNYKRLTKHFNFPCNFDKHGGCVSHTRPTCCYQCSKYVGYIKNIRPT